MCTHRVFRKKNSNGEALSYSICSKGAPMSSVRNSSIYFFPLPLGHWQTHVTVKRKVGPWWVTLPCQRHLGSCHYQDLCTEIPKLNVHLPPTVRCPFKKVGECIISKSKALFKKSFKVFYVLPSFLLILAQAAQHHFCLAFFSHFPIRSLIK